MPETQDPTPRPILSIEDRHPAEYAGLWGDGSSRGGMLFYSCAEAEGRYIIARTDWDSETWEELAREVDTLRARVLRSVSAGEDHWTEEDPENLLLLSQWARARAKGPQMFTYRDGLSGREIFRASEEVVRSLCGPGDHTDAARAGVDRVEWIGDAETIRASLRECGAWDSEELSDDDANRERILWLGACDISEDLEIYAN